MTDSTFVRVERDGAVASVVLARAEARNALNLAMCRGLIEAFETLSADPDVRVVLMQSEGPVFCAGADLKERTGRDETWVMNRRRESFRAYETIGRCAKPVVAVVQGPVVGSGGEIAMSCDFVVASTAATFRFPEPQWGTVGATQRLQRVIGRSRAKELLFTGRTMGVDEAYGLGLVARIVEPDALAATAEEIAGQIAAAPPLAMALTKQCVDLGSATDLESGIRIELKAIERNLAESDWRSGVADFADRIGTKAPGE